MEKIKAILDGIPVNENGKAFIRASVVEEIRTAATEPFPPGCLRGEDYYFCHLVRSCGLKIYADFGSPIIGHVGNVQYPITPDMVGWTRPSRSISARTANRSHHENQRPARPEQRPIPQR